MAPRAGTTGDTNTTNDANDSNDSNDSNEGAQEPSSEQTKALIERVARLELGIRRHRELAENRDRGMSTELEKILAAIATVATRGTTQAAKPGHPKTPLHAEVVYALPIDGVATEGPSSALVTIVVATDFTCGLCESLGATVALLQKEYGATLQVAHANHASGTTGHNAALIHCLADKAGKGKTMRTELWREQRVGISEDDLDERFSKAALFSLAQTLGARESALAQRKVTVCEEQIALERERFEGLGVSASPISFVNGRVVLGAQRLEFFRALIDAELIRAKRVIASGVRVKRYYDLVVASGYAPAR